MKKEEDILLELEEALGNTKKEKKSFVNKKIYEELNQYTGKELAWGILTGVRPTKLAMKKVEDVRMRKS